MLENQVRVYPDGTIMYTNIWTDLKGRPWVAHETHGYWLAFDSAPSGKVLYYDIQNKNFVEPFKNGQNSQGIVFTSYGDNKIQNTGGWFGYFIDKNRSDFGIAFYTGQKLKFGDSVGLNPANNYPASPAVAHTDNFNDMPILGKLINQTFFVIGTKEEMQQKAAVLNNYTLNQVVNNTPPADIEPPASPGNLTASVQSSSQINLSWTASTDNVGVLGYKVYRSGVQVGTSSTATYADTGLSVSTSYSYKVAAYDAAGNVSSQSAEVSAITKPTNQTPVISYFTASPSSIASNQSSTLSWIVVSPLPVTLTIDSNVGLVTGTSKLVFPSQTTTYTLTATNSAGSTTAQVKVDVSLVINPNLNISLTSTVWRDSGRAVVWEGYNNNTGGTFKNNTNTKIVVYAGAPYQIGWSSNDSSVNCLLDGVNKSSSGNDNSFVAGGGGWSRVHIIVCNNVSKSIVVSVPPDPIAVNMTCSADGKTLTLTWNRPSGYSYYYVRVFDQTTGVEYPEMWKNEYSGLPLLTGVAVPGHTYAYGVHTDDYSVPGGPWSNAPGGTVACPN